MPLPQELEYWLEEVSIAFPQLSRAQTKVLGLYSYGMSMTKSCGQTIVSVFLALLLGLKAQNLRQQLREFTYEAQQKRGQKRQSITVEIVFAPLLKWVLHQWKDKKKLILAADATYLRDRHTILTISVVYGKTAIPVAWKVLAGNGKCEWHPLWVELLAHIAPAIPSSTQVLILFDRGLYSKRLFKAVRQHNNWHPVMRIRDQGLYKRPKAKNWRNLKQLAYRGMSPHALRVQCFKGNTLTAYLWVQWDEVQDEACLLLSDLAPKQVKGNPYPLRMWIEANFKDWKRGGLHLEQCKIVKPERLERLLFVLALSLFHLIRLGNVCLPSTVSSSDPLRRLSLMTLGWINLLVSTIHDTPLLECDFHPYVLPPFHRSQKTYP